MKIKMTVKEGPKKQAEYLFPPQGESGDEANNILVGRDDISSEAHWRLSAEDQYVSRAHFMLEVRPPNCHLQDNMSMNGTFLLRSGQPEKRVLNEVLENGDRLRVGDTVLAFEIETVKPIGTVYKQSPSVTRLYDGSSAEKKPEQEKKPQQEKEPEIAHKAEMYCVRCGETLVSLPSIVGSLRNLDFMCTRCLGEVEAERKQKAEQHSDARFCCSRCRRDVTRMADRDGRAVELLGVATYLCESCFKEDLAKYAIQRRSLPEGKFGGYTLVKSLGKGGMGEVFKACEPETGRIAAIKQMLPITRSDEFSMGRFHREISIMQQLVHPNLVRMYAAGQEGDSPYFISEFVPGGDMSQFVSEQGEPVKSPGEIARIIADALSGLEFFHTGGGVEVKRVHRDLKPENILLWPENSHFIPKLADFGLSKSYEDHGGAITKTGEFAGTWMYMPPEQITNFKRARPGVDIYAMGVALYYLLSGQAPLPDFPPPWEIILKEGRIRLTKPLAQMVLHDERVPLAKRRSDLPREICRVADKAIAMKAEDRYPGAAAFREALLKAAPA